MDDDRRHRELDRRRDLESSLDAEKQAAILRQRYGNRRPNKGFGGSAVLPKRLLLPSVNDPGIWAVRCKEGKEREVVFSILKRIEERMGTKDEVGIISAFERGGPNSVMKGLIYIEANRQTDILVGLDGLLNVYPRTKLLLIEPNQRKELLRVTKTPTLEPGAWVRLRRPAKHSGDLAQVIDVTENGLEARVRFIPRLDYGMRDDSLQSLTADGKRKRAIGLAGPRPPQRLFSEVEARKRQPRHLAGNPTTNTWSYMNDDFENGFQVKDVKIQQLVVTDVNPSLEEVTRFASGAEDGTENLDLKALAASLKENNTLVTYVPGDVVEVYSGEQAGVVGKATNVQGDIVTMKVIEGDLRGQTIEVPTKGLRKRFRIGDHVKVIGGSKFRDEVGTVVKISEDRVTILTDHTHTEVTVFSKDLREASDIGGQGSLGQYSLQDLVQLDATTVGCIVKVDRESLVVLDQYGDIRQLMPSQISNKIPKRKQAVAADRNGSEIRLDDVVKEYTGLMRQGKIIHIHRSYLFLHTNDSNENAGVFVTKANIVNTIAAKGGRVTTASAGPDLNAMNPALKIHKNGAENKSGQPVKTFGRDRAINQTVIIKKGSYKGLLGIVKDTTDTHARVELHTKSKTITVAKECLSFKDKTSGATIDINGRGRGGSGTPSRSGFGDRPGWQASRTPMGAGGSDRVPAWGSQSKFLSRMMPTFTFANAFSACSWRPYTSLEGTGHRLSNPRLGRRIQDRQSLRRQPDGVRRRVKNACMAIGGQDPGIRGRFCVRVPHACIWRWRQRWMELWVQDARLGCIGTDSRSQRQRLMGLYARSHGRCCLRRAHARRSGAGGSYAWGHECSHSRCILGAYPCRRSSDAKRRLAERVGCRLGPDAWSGCANPSGLWVRQQRRLLWCADTGCLRRSSGDACCQWTEVHG